MQERASIYNKPFRSHSKKKSIQTTETINNDTLPSINNLGHHQKVNSIRMDLNETKSQIIIVKSKINSLRALKEKYEMKAKDHASKVDFINGIQKRMKEEHQYKNQIKKKHQQQEQLMKLKTQYLRQSMIRQRKNAQIKLYEHKSIQAQEERRKKKQHDYMIKKIRQMSEYSNKQKAQKVRQFHDQSASKLKEFHQSRIHFSRQNYQKKISSSLKEREKHDSLLKKLKAEEEMLLQDIKSSEKAMLSSLYNLESANPEKRKKFRFNSSDRSIKYDKEEFEDIITLN